jgi:hypothetical protein
MLSVLMVAWGWLLPGMDPTVGSWEPFNSRGGGPFQSPRRGPLGGGGGGGHSFCGIAMTTVLRPHPSPSGKPTGCLGFVLGSPCDPNFDLCVCTIAVAF